MKKQVLFYYAQTPVHCGSGSSLEVIDIPIQREKHTDFPIFQASSVKGTMRRFYELQGKDVNDIFGPDNGNDFASCVTFTDARVLFFPVKSFKNVFIWITCPLVLNRLKKDLNNIGINSNIKIPNITDDNSTVISGNKSKLCLDDKLVLDEYVFNLDENQKLDINIDFPEKDRVLNQCAVISDEMYKYFVKTACEVVARTKIDNETGVVQKGQLWYEENLPSESILYSLVFANKSKNEKSDLTSENVLENLKNNIPKIIQIGGNETIGKGIVELSWLNSEKDGE
jgi:CRISPR-associated protein Cmr4